MYERNENMQEVLSMKPKKRCFVLFSILVVVSTFATGIYYNKAVRMLQKNNAVLIGKLADMEEMFLSELQRGEFEITAYESSKKSCGKWAKYNKTKSGTTPHKFRTVAVDPLVIPIGSLVYIEGIGWRVAEDSGKLVKGNTIDLFVDSYSEAMQFGRQKLTVYYNKSTGV
ncbi:3D domain protein [Candidatus Magnetobacterium bavaricum]|uniref:3D domain protein n=1 Tax=Candidatus Magnetobacterium bavaricum TaxID=29290 RepID=A0A0F3GVJ7_9BACT|nr:3D domain protein [Candidatus Magnetobacterium bavaricum]